MHKLTRLMVAIFGLALVGMAADRVQEDRPTAAEGKIIAVYGEAVGRTNVPPGWSFQWNAAGTINSPTGFASLVCIESSAGKRKSVTYGVPDDAGGVRQDRPSYGWFGDTFSVRDQDGTVRYAIASYVMPQDAVGDIWINNGNLKNSGYAGGSVLEIYINSERVFKTQVAPDRIPLLFQKQLGRLKKADVIRVAVGPGEKAAKGGGRLRYTIEEFPEGQKPGEPASILWLPMSADGPQRDADGRYTTYLAQHKAQCDAVLSNKPDLVFIGDSITARFPPEMLQEKYGKYRPVKLAVGGDWIQNVIWRVLNGVLDKVRIKVIVLLIGTNNIGPFSQEEIVQGYERLLKTLHEKTPESKVLILGIFPRGPSIKDPGMDKVRQVNAKLALLADNKTFFFLDIGDKLVEPDGTISEKVMPDKLHVAMPGFVRWLDAMGPTLDKLLDNP